MYFRLLLVLAVAVALPWASATEEERNFKVFKGLRGIQSFSKIPIGIHALRDEADERSFKSFLRGAKNLALGAVGSILGREEEERNFKLFKNLKGISKVPLPINAHNYAFRDEADERSFKSFLRGAKNLALGAVGSILGREEEERSFKSVMSKIGGVALKLAGPAVTLGTKIFGREDEERKLKGLNFLKDYPLNPIHFTGRDEEEERSFKSFIKKVGKVALKVAPLAVGAATLLGRENEEERSFKSFLKKAAGVAVGLAGPAITLGTKIFGREDEEERSFKSFIKKVGKVALKVAPLAIGAATLIGRENEEERSFKSFLKKAAGVAVGLAGPAITLGTKIFGREAEEERSFKSFIKKVGKVALKVAPLAIGAATLIGRDE